MDHATLVRDGRDATIIACGEMVSPAKAAAEILTAEGIDTRVLDMYCVKPIDRAAVLAAAEETHAIVTVEEHAPFGGLGSMVAQIVSEACPKRVLNIALPDAPVITGNSQQVFDHYGMNAAGIAARVREALA